MKFETENAKLTKTQDDMKQQESVFLVEEESKICELESQDIDLEELLKSSQVDASDDELQSLTD